MERDVESIWERMQALKIMKLVVALCPSKFPASFTRSLVAVASHKDDNFRRVCLETLRELSVCNAPAVYQANGFRVLFEAVLDPMTSELAEPILMSMLFLLNHPDTRYVNTITTLSIYYSLLLNQF
jgi:rapamycin-insensitive companion of mTOR